MRESFYKVMQELSITDEKKIYLVCHAVSHVCYVKKVLPPQTDISLYEQLQAHPHPNMANIIEFENREDALVLIEEFVNGTTLAYARSAGKLSSELKQTIFYELFDVLQHLHELNPPIIHRDIKPENIMLEHGHVKLIDFEIARKVQQDKQRDTQIIGSVGYAAPEQYGFRQSDQRSDIYALGVLMKEMMIEDESSRYQTIISRCLEMEPSRRYQNIKELRRAFQKQDYSYQTPKPTVSYLPGIPGFQHETLSSKLLIFAFYIIVLLVSFTMTPTTPTTMISLFFQRLSFAVVFLLMLWVPKNVGNILELFPFYQSKYKLVRILNAVVIWMIASLLSIVVFVILATFIESFL